MNSKVFIMIPIKPSTSFLIYNQLMESIRQLDVGGLDRVEVVFDHVMEPAQPGDSTPWSKVTRVRNRMLEQQKHIWKDFDYILWIDANVFKFPTLMLKDLLYYDGGKGGVTAPMVLIDGTETFYNWSAFIQTDKDQIEPELHRIITPYWPCDPLMDVVPMDCVGSCYLVGTDVYKRGIRHEDHPSFTDHYPICRSVRAMMKSVCVVRSVVAYHAYLPHYGEEWH